MTQAPRGSWRGDERSDAEMDRKLASSAWERYGFWTSAALLMVTFAAYVLKCVDVL